MRHAVLAALRTNKGIVSGESLARELGVSRVAVWKQVRELRSLGYVVLSSSKGYRLQSCPDLLLPAEFPGWESIVHHLPAADSTMHLARTLARQGAGEGTLVIAEQQTAGRGRLDRSWLSPRGGIYMTLITRPAVAPAQAPRINLLVAVVVAAAIERLYGLAARVKWPNDVLIGEKKVCGILAEMDAECDAVRFVNVGIGLNANSVIAAQQPSAVSLLEMLGAPVNRVQLVTEIVQGILDGLPRLTGEALLDEWRERTITIGRHVSIVAAGTSVSGVAIGINSSGALLVRDSSGQTHEVVAGDCVHASETE
jgi:BirA family biotin operon repressor/biotin-[acetyl-CoA-carboxylase] ligase